MAYAQQQYIDYACGFSMLYNQIQGEHTLIFRPDITVTTYGSNYLYGYIHLNIRTSRTTFTNFDINRRKFCLVSYTLFHEPTRLYIS